MVIVSVQIMTEQGLMSSSLLSPQLASNPLSREREMSRRGDVDGSFDLFSAVHGHDQQSAPTMSRRRPPGAQRIRKRKEKYRRSAPLQLPPRIWRHDLINRSTCRLFFFVASATPVCYCRAQPPLPPQQLLHLSLFLLSPLPYVRCPYLAG